MTKIAIYFLILFFIPLMQFNQKASASLVDEIVVTASKEDTQILKVGGNISSINTSLELFKSSDSVISFPEFRVMLENRINKKSNEVKIHVLLSRKSVVFCTPPICCESPPNVEASPPPLGF